MLSPRSIIYLCTVGHYCPTANEHIACPAGTFQPYTYETTTWSCQHCPIGKYSATAGSQYCTNCSTVTVINSTTC